MQAENAVREMAGKTSRCRYSSAENRCAAAASMREQVAEPEAAGRTQQAEESHNVKEAGTYMVKSRQRGHPPGGVQSQPPVLYCRGLCYILAGRGPRCSSGITIYRRGAAKVISPSR